MRIIQFVSVGILFALLQSCGGSGGGQPASNSNQNPEPFNPPNPLGGIWVSADNSASFLITENGRFMTQLFLDESLAGIGTGSGQIDVSDSDDINTQFTISGIVVRPGESDPLPTQEDAFSPHQCSTTGTKNGDALHLTVKCTVNDTEFEINPTLRQRLICEEDDDCVNAPSAYALDSSMEKIIGDFGVYNTNAQALTVMEIDYLGIMNGRFQFSSWDCGMAGAITTIDPRYNLYDITFENVSCASPNMSLEHTRWKGLLFMSAGETEAQQIFLMAQSQPRTGDLVREISYTLPRL